MTNLIKTAAVAAILSTAPAFAEVERGDVAEFLALSDESAAERILNETSMGDLTQEDLMRLYSSMSPAEREQFYVSDDASRMAMIEAKMKTAPANSPAEAAAVTN